MLAKVCSAAINGIEAYPSKWKRTERQPRFYGFISRLQHQIYLSLTQFARIFR
jgi:hypothetical protein